MHNPWLPECVFVNLVVFFLSFHLIHSLKSAIFRDKKQTFPKKCVAMCFKCVVHLLRWFNVNTCPFHRSVVSAESEKHCLQLYFSACFVIGFFSLMSCYFHLLFCIYCSCCSLLFLPLSLYVNYTPHFLVVDFSIASFW